MNDIVETILETYGMIAKLDDLSLVESRRKITSYIETLASAGQNDAQKLAMYGLAYLKQLHEGTDPRYSGW
jgi:hypothetical protein